MKYLTILLLTIVLAATGCQNKESNASNEDAAPEKTVENKKYILTPFEKSYEYSDASLKDFSYLDGVFNFELGESNYELGTQTPDADTKMCANSGKGQHIHLIVNDAPYAAKYTSNFSHKVPDGEHYMLAFLSRSYHESIKTETANLTKKITVLDSTITKMEDVKERMLFYSRPKGTYVGKDTKKVMLDFYLNNLALTENGYHIEAKINGESHIITEWSPYYIEGLPIGENTVTLTLLDGDGEKVKAPLNPVSRKFILKEDPAETM